MAQWELFVATLVMALVSLGCTFVLFRYLASKATGEAHLGTHSLTYGGAIAGFVIIFGLLYWTFASLLPASEGATPIDIDGKWRSVATLSNGTRLEGRAVIRQKHGSIELRITGEFQDAGNPSRTISFSSVAGVIRDRTAIFVYENGNGERGVSTVDIADDHPVLLRSQYWDLEGYDKNNDPVGEMIWTRE